MNKNLKIIFAANIAPNSRGGVARSINMLGNYLSNKNHPVDYFFNNNSLSYPVFSLSLALYLLKRIIFNPPDWVISRSTDAFFSLLLIKIFRLKTKVILYNHGWEPLVYEVEKRLPSELIDNPTTFKAKLIRFPMLRTTLKLSDIIICGTIHESRYLKSEYPSKSNSIKYLPNPILIKNSYERKSTVKPVLLSIANNNWKKNLSYTIELFNKVKVEYPDAKLICAGTSLTHKEFGDLFEDRNNIKNIRSIPPENMDEIYNSADILISTSQYEGGHSFAILEAMNNGLTIVASAIPSSMEIIKNNFNGHIISGHNIHRDSEVLKDVLKKDNINIRIKAQKSIRRYSINKIGPQLERILSK